MWFDEIMDDCKKALVTAGKYKGIFIPIFLKLALSLGIFAYIIISFVASIYKYRYIIEDLFNDRYSFTEILPGIIISGIIIYLLVLVGFSIIEVGGINMYKTALGDQKPRFKDFMDGIKNCLLKVILGKLLLHIAVIITLPITAFLFIFYALIVGTLTAGLGFIFLGVFISIYFSTWIPIVVIEGCSPVRAIIKGFKLGSKYFKGLFIIMLASTLISSYSAVIFGILAAILAGWFISGLAATYFQLVVMQIYYRNKELI